MAALATVKAGKPDLLASSWCRTSVGAIAGTSGQHRTGFTLVVKTLQRKKIGATK